MKKSAIISLLIIGLIFQNCKNNKSQKDVLPDVESEQVIESEVDTTVILDNIETEEVVATIREREEVQETLIKSEEKTTVIEETEAIVESEGKIEEDIEKEDSTDVEPAIEKEETISNSIEWVVPSEYQNLKNPINPKEDTAIGKSLYSKHCKSCHGKQGYGDGPKADEMEGDLGDFSSEKFQAQSDGALYYKTTIGRLDMPEYTKKIPDNEDRWLVVNYMRTLIE